MNNDENIPVLTFAAPDADDHTDRSSPRMAVDLQRVIDDGLGFLVTGSSGSGKSHLVRGLLEQTHGRVQQIVFDSEGEYVTLREKFDYLLAAKAGGDIPLAPATAALLCRRVMQLGVSLLLDLYELRPPERQAYVAAFLAELIETPIEHRRPVFVAIPEVHLYAPQGPSTPAKEAVRDLVARGRKRGLMPIFDTQSIGKTDKTALEALRNKLVGYIELDVHLDRAAADLGLRGEDREKLRQLPRGHFFAQGPALSKQVTLVRTGPNQTHAPAMGAGVEALPSLPTPSAIQEILAQLGDLPEQAEEEVKSLEAARKRIMQLEAKIASGLVSVLAVTPASLAAAPMAPEPKVVTIIDEVPALDAKTLASAKELAEQMMSHGSQLLARGQEIVQQLARWHREPSAAVSPSQEPAAADADSAPVPPAVKSTKEAKNAPAPEPDKPDKPAAQNPTNPGKSNSSADGVTAPQQRILNALAGFAAVGIHQVARANVAVWAGVSPVSSGYGNNVSTLRTMGLIDYPKPGLLTLTPAGAKIAEAPRELLSSTGALLEAWCRKLPAPQAKILRVLHASYPKSMERGALADAVGVSRASSGYGNNVSALRSLELIEYPRPGLAVATALLFPEGLPK